ncbi:MAG: hypothetical protein ACOYML_04045 [Microthrixaceae bacterium]
MATSTTTGPTAEAAEPDVTDQHPVSRRTALAAIFLISLAGLLLEVAYTRVISYKLWYYYTYLVIGLALLGIGSGATVVVLSPRLRRAGTRSILQWSSLWGAISIIGGYLIISQIPINTLALWSYGTAGSFKALATLGVICFALFATFIAVGIMIATLLGRGGDDIGRLYFADLLGAGIAALIVVFLIAWVGPPSVIALAACAMAALAAWVTPSASKGAKWGAFALAVALAVPVVVPSLMPDPRPEDSKIQGSENRTFSAWGPVFRVDVDEIPDRPDVKILTHDGTHGSGLNAFDGNPDAVTRFDTDPRSWPFDILGTPPSEQLIVGSAGGNEIVASLSRNSQHIDAVELNPVTVGLVRDTFADYTGNLTEFPQVDLTQGDGRSFLARSPKQFDLVWFVAPDSYAANNAASSGAFVLSESYLYTADMIETTLDHLSDRGISVAQFGERSFTDRPNRTARYLLTAREAFQRLGIDDFGQHVMVATSNGDPLSGGLSTIVLKREPFTQEEVDRFVASVTAAPENALIYAPGAANPDTLPSKIPAASQAELDQLLAAYPFRVEAITDDAPFFWHFSPFDRVLRDMPKSVDPEDRENAVGERVLLLLLVIATVFAVVFLLLPFAFIRKEWKALPAKGLSAVYFAALGLAFMLYEVTMIQRLTEYLGFPTYSLTVTLASILVFTGIGALLSNRFADNPKRALPVILGALVALTVFYRFALAPITDATLSAPFAVRVLISFAVLAPLGLCLGMFMPLGLRTVGAMSDHADEYVAWGWAINGVFSVVGSVLTTILAMSWGFRTVQVIALCMYLFAGLALWQLRNRHDQLVAAVVPADEAEPELVGQD